MNFNKAFSLRVSSSKTSNHILKLTMFCSLILLSCDAEIKSLEFNNCFRCRKFFKEYKPFQPKTYLTRHLIPFDNRNIACGANYAQLAKERFKNIEEISAVSSNQTEKLINNIYCLIGLNLDSFKSMLPKDAKESRHVKEDSTVLISILVDTVKKNEEGATIWMGSRLSLIHI